MEIKLPDIVRQWHLTARVHARTQGCCTDLRPRGERLSRAHCTDIGIHLARSDVLHRLLLFSRTRLTAHRIISLTVRHGVSGNRQNGTREIERHLPISVSAPRHEVGETDLPLHHSLIQTQECSILVGRRQLRTERAEQCIRRIGRTCRIEPPLLPRRSEVYRRVKHERIDHAAHDVCPPFDRTATISSSFSCVSASGAEREK